MTSAKTFVPADGPWVAVTDEPVRDMVQALLHDLGASGKSEFQGLSARVMTPSKWRPRKDTHPPIAVIAGADDPSRIMNWLDTMDPSPALFFFVERYEADVLERAYQGRCLHLRGVFRKKGFADPDERGIIAEALKEAIRQHPNVRERVVPKRLGWKISVGERYPRRLVSLVLDRQMRAFIHATESAVSRVSPIPAAPAHHGERVMDAFAAIGQALAGNGTRTVLSQLAEVHADVLRVPSLRPEPILLEGESGTGKTLVADWIARRLTDQPAIRVPIVNVSAELLEAELFGSLSGAFTDAVSRPGVFHRARGRVVFLDEIGDAPLEVQAKLLTYLDDFGFTPRGWPFVDEARSPVYVVAATNRGLKGAMESGAFRPDLYYRFRHRLTVPPLRDRKADLRVLIDFTLQDPSINGQDAQGRQVEDIAIDALEKLERYAFPGNFRELEDLLSRAVFNAVSARRRTVTAADIELP
ncbi:MAG: sigma 54-interacting transcriptional regulator [Vicinamibacterales bacterium]